MNCSVCNGVMRAWIDMPIDPKKGEPMAFGQIFRCDSCGLGRSANMTQPEEIVGFYDLTASYTHGQSHMPAPRAKLINRILVRLDRQTDRAHPFDIDAFAKVLPIGGGVLDLGCGDCEKLEEFHKRLARDAVRHSRLRASRLLARSAFTPALRKYDSIGIVASRTSSASMTSQQAENQIAA